MPFTIVQQDITEMHTDAIVNAANTRLLMGGGVCGAIFSKAGARQLQEACDRLSPIHTGEAVITPGFHLKAKYIIHTAGPVYAESKKDECRQLLKASYRNSLELAEEKKCTSIAFPLISAGIYGYPKEEALETAIETIKEFLKNSDMHVYLTIFGRETVSIQERLKDSLDRYISENYTIDEIGAVFSRSMMNLPEAEEFMECSKASAADFDFELDESFQETLFRLIDQKNMTDVEVYKRANMDRKLFSKIRSKKNYIPKKHTILALCIALRLSLKETKDLLEKAGYALSHSNRFDIIIEYFIVHQDYDIYEINEVLFRYDQPLLGE